MKLKGYLLLVIVFMLGLSMACMPVVPDGQAGAMRTITGEVVVRDMVDPMPLPAGATITVQALDTSVADAAADVLGEQFIDDAQSLPVSYAIEIDPAAARVEDGAITTSEIDVEITARFGNGHLGGNSYNADYEVNGTQLTLSPVNSTLMACPEERMAREVAFLEALREVTGYNVVGETLELTDEFGNTRLVFFSDEVI